MTRIVTTHYRYTRPARKRKVVALEAPAVVAAKSSRRLSLGGRAAAEVSEPPAITTTGQRAQSSTRREAERVASPLAGGRAGGIPGCGSEWRDLASRPGAEAGTVRATRGRLDLGDRHANQ